MVFCCFASFKVLTNLDKSFACLVLHITLRDSKKEREIEKECVCVRERERERASMRDSTAVKEDFHGLLLTCSFHFISFPSVPNNANAWADGMGGCVCVSTYLHVHTKKIVRESERGNASVPIDQDTFTLAFET